ncbi:MAG: MMPL family transporter [Myxococcota bacterium]
MRGVFLAVILLGGALLAAGASQLETSFDPADLIAGPAPEPTFAFLLTDERGDAIDALSRALLDLGAEVTSATTVPLPRRGEGDLDAILTLIEAAPAAFPGGLAAIGERLGGEFVIAPLGDGEAFDDEDREAFTAARPLLEGRLLLPSGRALVLAKNITLEQASAVARDHGAELTGLPVLKQTLEDRLHQDAIRLLSLALLLTAVLLLAVFRRADVASGPLLCAGVAIALTFGCAGWLGIPMSILTAITPPVLLTVCVGDALHLLVRFGAGGPTPAAESRRALFRACLATTLTTAAGFASLSAAQSGAIVRFGLLTTLGVFFAFGAVMGLLPLLLARAKPPPKRWGRIASMPLLGRLAMRVHRRRAAVLATAAGFALLAGAGVARVNVGTRLLAPFGADDEAAALAREIDADFGGLRRMRWVVNGPAHAPETLERLRELGALARAGGAAVRSPATVLDGAWSRLADGPLPDAAIEALAALAAPALVDLEAADQSRLELTFADAPAETFAAVGAQALAAGADEVHGEAWRTGNGLAQLQSDLAGTFGVAVTSVFLLILLFFGPRLCAAALLPNLLPLLGVLGYMGARGIALDLSTAMVFAVTLGLVVDGTLHLLAAQRAHQDLEAAFRHSGGAVILGGASLLVGFASLAFSDLLPLQHFAELAGVAITLATLAEFLLLPACLPAKKP